MGSDLPSTDSRSAGSSAGSAVSLILVESTVHSSEPISTPRDADFRARPTGTTPRAARIATWWGLGSSPRMTKAPFTVAGKRSKWVRIDTASRTSPVMRSPARPRSGPLLPRVQVLLLLWGEGVDLDPHRVQLQP